MREGWYLILISRIIIQYGTENLQEGTPQFGLFPCLDFQTLGFCNVNRLNQSFCGSFVICTVLFLLNLFIIAWPIYLSLSDFLCQNCCTLKKKVILEGNQPFLGLEWGKASQNLAWSEIDQNFEASQEVVQTPSKSVPPCRWHFDDWKTIFVLHFRSADRFISSFKDASKMSVDYYYFFITTKCF